MTFFNKTSVLTLLMLAMFAGLLPSALWSQDASNPASDAEYKFAMALARNGFMEEANTLVDRVLKGSSKDLAKARILKITGDIERSVDAKDKYYEQALELLNAFLQANPDDANAFDAQFDKGSILQMRGQVRSEAILAEVDPAKRDVMIAEAETILNEASTMFAAMFKKVKGNKDMEETAASALYYWGRTFYHLGLCYPPADTRRDDAFKKALQKFEDFQWEYARYFQIINVYKYQGMVREAQEKWLRAAGDYNQSRTVIEKVAEANGFMPSYLEDLYHELTWRVCDMNNRGGKYDVSIKVTSDWLEKYPLPASVEEWGNFQQGIVLEKAKALYGTGADSDAVEFAKLVAKTGGYYSGPAIRALTGWGVSDLDPGIILLQGRNERVKGNDAEALSSLSAAMQAVLSQGKENYPRNAIVYMNACREMSYLFYQDKNPDRQNHYAAATILKAAVDFHMQFKSLPELYGKLTEEDLENIESVGAFCAFQRRLCYLEREKLTSSAEDRMLINEARDAITQGYPDRASNEFYFNGKQIDDEGDALFAAKEWEKAIEKYQQAIVEYKKVPATTDFYERSLLRYAQATRSMYMAQERWNRYGKPAADKSSRVTKFRDEAVTLFQKYIEYTEKKPANEGDAKKNRAQYAAKAAYQIGSLYYDSAQATEDKKEKQRLFELAVNSLADYDKKHNEVKEYIPYAAYYETLSLVKLGRIADAQKRLDFLINQWGADEAKYLSMACYEVGKATEDDKKKQAFYFAKWIQLEPVQPISNYQYVGNVFLALGQQLEIEAVKDPSKAAERDHAFRSAQDIYKRLMVSLEKDRTATDDDRFDATTKLGNVSYRLGDWQAVVDSFEDIYNENKPQMEKLEAAIQADGFSSKSDRDQAKRDLTTATNRVARVAMDLAFALYKTGRKEESFAIYEFLMPRSENASERWWICKYFVFRVMVDQKDESALGKLKSLRASYPDLGGKIVLDGRFLSEWFNDLFKELGA